MAVSIGGYSTLLFGVGLVALVSSCLQILVYSKAIYELRQSASSQGSQGSQDDFSTLAFASSTSPLTVAYLSLAVSCATLAITAVFTGLDLAGMIVLRSRMWIHFSSHNTRRYMASAYGQVSWPPLTSKAASCQWPAEGKAYEYEIPEPSMSIAWWQQWVFLEDLVFSFQRNLALIRLSASMLLAVLWAPIVVQLAVVSLTSRCHSAPGEVAQACDLMRKGTIGAVATWASWTLLATLLVVFNTNPRCSRPQLSALPFMRVPMPSTGCGPVDCHASLSLPLGHKQQQQQRYSLSLPTKGSVVAPQSGPNQTAQHHSQHQNQPSGYSAFQHKPQHPGLVPGGAGQRKPQSQSYRSSWSYMDKSSIMSELGKGDSQGMGQSGGKGNALLHSQNMVHQFYHLQNQQFQSLHQIQQASRISEEQLHFRQQQQQQLASHTAVQRQLSLMLQAKSAHSSASAVSEQSLVVDDTSSTAGNEHSRHECNPRFQQMHLQMVQQMHCGAEQHRTSRGLSVSCERTPQALESLNNHSRYSVESKEKGGDRTSKRNTIG